MTRVLFVSNGHGEEAIAERLAVELHELQPALVCDHVALVGDSAHHAFLHPVGPRRAMPSGGLVAMGNVVNLIRDLRSGLLQLTLAQLRFFRQIRGEYQMAAAIGDTFSLWMALRARARATVFVGTAKSIYVAPYGRWEESVLRRAAAVFVRDRPTADRLRAHGIEARAANVIADLHREALPLPPLPFEALLGLFPGSRNSAYDDAVFLAGVARRVARAQRGTGAVLSLARNLDPGLFASALARDGWTVVTHRDDVCPFSLYDGESETIRAWSGPIGSILVQVRLALGQAGTANEAAASAGVPVIAFVRHGEVGGTWYRRRQAHLLREALLLVERDEQAAALAVRKLLADSQRLLQMREAGRSRVGPPGAKKIAAALAAFAAAAS